MVPKSNKRLLLVVAGAGLFLLGLVLYLWRRWQAGHARVHQLERELAALRHENGVLDNLIDRQNDTLIQLRVALDGGPEASGQTSPSFTMPPFNFGLQTRIQPIVFDGTAAFRAWGKHADRYVEVRVWDDGYTCDLVTNDERRRVVQQYVGAHNTGQPDMKQIGADVRKLFELPLYNPSKEPNHDEPTT